MAQKQSKLDVVEELPRGDRMLHFSEPIQIDSRPAAWLRGELERVSKKHGFSHEFIVEENMLKAVSLTSVTDLHREDVGRMVEEAVAALQAERGVDRIALGIKLPFVETEKVTFDDYRKKMCRGCDRFKFNHDGTLGKFPFADCLSASWGPGGRKRDAEFRAVKRDRIRNVETRPMELGTNAHSVLDLRRGTEKNISRMFDALVKGERVIWSIGMCDTRLGLRAVPDAVISKLTKQKDGDYLLEHVVIEDKIAPKQTYWMQLWHEEMIMTSDRFLLHAVMPHDKDPESLETMGVPFMPTLRNMLGLSDNEIIHVKVSGALNPYYKPNNPQDSYTSWVLRTPPPQGFRWTPVQWSEDGHVLRQAKDYDGNLLRKWDKRAIVKRHKSMRGHELERRTYALSENLHLLVSTLRKGEQSKQAIKVRFQGKFVDNAEIHDAVMANKKKRLKAAYHKHFIAPSSTTQSFFAERRSDAVDITDLSNGVRLVKPLEVEEGKHKEVFPKPVVAAKQ